jgi:hypothetical protein
MEGPVVKGVTVTRGPPKGKGKKGRGANLAEQYEKDKLSNYDLLARLGFSEELIGENRMLGLKEKKAMKNYVIHVEDHGAERAAKAMHVYEKKKEERTTSYKTYEEETDDWKFMQLAPPPKTEAAPSDLVAISDMPPFARQAFSTTKSLNQIQSIVYPVAFKQPRSMIIAAPTGAGKTNVALLTILRQVSEHVDITSEGPWDMKGKPF